jgi:ORF6N domain
MELTPTEQLTISKIYIIRNQRVMMDFDLAEIYGVETKALKRAVKRNLLRFPDDFMFELSEKEFENLRCQIGTSSWGGSRYLPFAFTEHGTVMLASVLNSETAIKASIFVVRAFIKLKQILNTYQLLSDRIDELEDKYDEQLDDIMEAIRALSEQKNTPRVSIGFKNST